MNSLSMQIIVACVLKLHFIHGSVKLITNQNRNQQNYKLKAQGFNMSTSVHLIHIFIYLIL